MKKQCYILTFALCCFSSFTLYGQKYESVYYMDVISAGYSYGGSKHVKLDMLHLRVCKYFGAGAASFWIKDFNLKALTLGDPDGSLVFWFPLTLHYPIRTTRFTSIGVQSRLYWLPMGNLWGGSSPDELPRISDMAFRFEKPYLTFTTGYRFEFGKWRYDGETIGSFSGLFVELTIGLSGPIRSFTSFWDFEMGEGLENRRVGKDSASIINPPPITPPTTTPPYTKPDITIEGRVINLTIAGKTVDAVTKYTFMKKTYSDIPPDEFTFEVEAAKTYQPKLGKIVQVSVKVKSIEQFKQTLYSERNVRLRGILSSTTNAFLPYDIVKLPDGPGDKSPEILIYKWED